MKSEINSFLLNYFKNKGTFNKVIYDSASYSLNIGGKRIRPLLLLVSAIATGSDSKRFMRM